MWATVGKSDMTNRAGGSNADERFCAGNADFLMEYHSTCDEQN